MTPLPVIANTFRCALNWQGGPQIAENVIHVRAAAATPSSILAALNLGSNANMWSSVASGPSVVSVSITPLDGSSATEEFAVSGSGWAGATAGNYAPAVAAVVSLATGLRGRSHRGRVYIPFTADASHVDGTLLSSKVTALNTGWASFMSGLGSGVELVVASYKLSTASPVTVATAKAGCATQRRRQRRVSYP